MKQKKRFMQTRSWARTLAVLALVFPLLLTACGSTPTSAPTPTVAEAQPAAPTAAPTEAPTEAAAPVAVPGVTNTEIVLGSWGPQDGPAGAYGIIDRTIAAYFEMVNDQGGINGRTIRFIYENDSYEPAKTVAAVKKLVEEDEVFGLVGGLGTAQNMAVMDYLIEHNVPHVGPATGSTAIALPLKPNVYAIQLNYRTEATLLAQYALDEMEANQIAVFYQNDAFGQEGLDAVNAELEKRGLPEAIGVSYEAADTNFASQALKLQTSGADTVILWAVPKPGGSVIAEMTKIGFAPQLLASAVINDPAIFELAGPGIEGLVIPAWIPAYDDLTNPKIVEYQEFMKQYAPEEQIGGFSLSGYCEAMVMAEGLRRAGQDLTRESFMQTMDQMQNYDGSPLPNVSYSATDHAGVKTAYLQRAEGGNWVSFTDWVTVQ